jgi:hypothetical protein
MTVYPDALTGRMEGCHHSRAMPSQMTKGQIAMVAAMVNNYNEQEFGSPLGVLEQQKP